MAAPALTTQRLAPTSFHSTHPPPSCAGLECELHDAVSFWRKPKCLKQLKWKNARQQLNTRCSSVRVFASGGGQQRSRVVTHAIPVAVSYAVTLAVVGAAVVAISKKEKLPTIIPENTRTECEECKGSGICPSCNGDGFLLKTPSKEVAARARSNAKDAATRYTAGLAKKWSYCGTCSGGRGCPACEGRGWLSSEN